jgi:methylated-DNA-[protein]-cysteine S-methyltransferase
VNVSQQLFSSIFQIPAGWMGILASNQGLRRVTFPQKSENDVRESLGCRLEQPKPDITRFRDLGERFRAYFSGAETDFPDRLDLSGATPFQREVWLAARLIPYGQTKSYQWVATQIGKPGAARAVGQALGRNPLPVIVPCHRVIASSDGLGGFSGGLETKKWLLRLESHPMSHLTGREEAPFPVLAAWL